MKTKEMNFSHANLCLQPKACRLWKGMGIKMKDKQNGKSKYNKKHIAIAAFAGIGIIIVLVLIALLIKGLFLGEKEDRETSAAHTTGVEILSEKDTPEGEGEAAEEPEEGQIQGEENGQAQPAGGGENMLIAAEVAGMEDEEDPQEAESMNEDGAGAQSDIRAMIKGANETGDISYGIDVAKWQGTIDWQQVAQSGVEFAIVRVGYRTQKTGIIMEDPLAKYNMQQADEAGIKLGAYFFSTAVTEEEAREEAAWVTSFIARYPVTYPVVYNCEGFQSSESRQYGLDKSARTDMAVAFLEYVQDKGYMPMFYASKNEMEGNALWDTDRLASQYKIWVSQYPDVPYPQTAASSYSGTHHMWQYTSQGTVPGIGKGVDMNVAYFSYSQTAEAVDDTPYEAVEADPEALLNMTEVNEQVTAKIEANLRTVPSTSGNDTIVGKLKNGEVVTRTATSASGWSRLEYNGQRVYAVSSYLTTELDYQVPETAAGSQPSSIYQPVSETVTAKNVTNLRNVASSASDDTIVAVLHNGETVTRIGVGSNGWSQVDYNGQTLYAISSYLTTDLSYVQTLRDTSIYTEVNEQVTPKIECNLRTEPSTQNEGSIVATIKNGDVVTRTGINDSTGWSRLDYNGQTVYAVSSYLTSAQ